MSENAQTERDGAERPFKKDGNKTGGVMVALACSKTCGVGWRRNETRAGVSADGFWSS